MGVSAWRWTLPLAFCLAALPAWGEVLPTAKGVLRINPDFHAFGEVAVGEVATATFTAENSGREDVAIGEVAVQGGNGFRLAEDSCTAAVQAPGDVCRIRVEFVPRGAGDQQGELVISWDGGGEPKTTVAVLSGTGLLLQGGIQVSLSEVAFGEATIGETVERTVTIRNQGTAALQLGRLRGLEAPFSLAAAADHCSEAVLEPGAPCSFVLAFTPSAAGSFSDTLEIPSNDPDRPLVTLDVDAIAVTAGTGGDPEVIPGPDIWVTDAVLPADDLILPFGDVPLGMAKRKLVYVANRGTEDLQLGLIPAGAINDQFRIIGLEENRFDCSERLLRPRQSCFIVVAFRPTGEGSFSGELTLPSNDPDNNPVAVQLAGAGVPASAIYRAPVLIHPKPGQVDLREDVTCRWYNCRDQAGRLATYRVYCSKAADFSDFWLRLIGQRALGMAAIGAGGILLLSPRQRRQRWGVLILLILAGTLVISCSDHVEDSSTATFSELDRESTYHWKVVAEYEDGLEAESQVQSFTVR